HARAERLRVAHGDGAGRDLGEDHLDVHDLAGSGAVEVPGHADGAAVAAAGQRGIEVAPEVEAAALAAAAAELVAVAALEAARATPPELVEPALKAAPEEPAPDRCEPPPSDPHS